ncbi:MAG: hypothetical protein PHG66_04760 [Candidatus Colwellbacteria bacterium]|nr:hypothetical protein [Candidatus Colwellbacteria bacterium]
MSVSNNIAAIVSCLIVCAFIGISFYLFKKKGIRWNTIKLSLCAFDTPILGVWTATDKSTITVKSIANVSDVYLITSLGGALAIKVNSTGVITTTTPNPNTFSDNIIGQLNLLPDGSYSISLSPKNTRTYCTVCPDTETTYIKSECVPKS